jgi:serine/threonine protein kinase
MSEGGLDKMLAHKQGEIIHVDLLHMYLSLYIGTNLIRAAHTISGMHYLEQNNVIHRDLSLRNLLVSKVDGKYIVKVTDFGMSRSTEEGYYRTEEQAIPVKWSAPEVTPIKII